MIKTPDFNLCCRMPDAREELNRSLSEGRMESRHSIKCLEGIGSRSHHLEGVIVTLFQMKKKWL